MKFLTNANKKKLSERLYPCVREGAAAVIEHAAAAGPPSLPKHVSDFALHRGLVEDDVDALWAGLRQSVRLSFAFRDPTQHYYQASPPGYTHVWNIVLALATGDRDLFAKWIEHVPATLTTGHAWTLAVSNAVTAMGRNDDALMRASQVEMGRQLRAKGLGNYERAILEILDGGLRDDAARVAAGLEASLAAWPKFFGSNKWRDDWFVVMDAIAFFNLVRTRVGAPIAVPEHERWRTPPPWSHGAGPGLLDFSSRLPMVDRWWRQSPERADESEWTK